MKTTRVIGAAVGAAVPLFIETERIGENTNVGLSERELQKCKARGIDPAKYAAMKLAMTAKGR